MCYYMKMIWSSGVGILTDVCCTNDVSSPDETAEPL